MGDNEHNQDPELIFPGPVALIAGPGSGKTTRLARRIKHLVEDRETDPESITVITFTVEAARNMKARLTPPAKAGMPDVTLPPELHPPTICTMHSLGARIIREDGKRLGITPEYRLVRSNRVRGMLFQDAARHCREDSDFGRVCDDQKQLVGAPADLRQAAVFDAYRGIMDACNAIDYDDQIILACQVLRENEEVRNAWKSKTSHLLVDEYQDINRPQLEMIQLLSGEDPSGLFVVGDDDQSIYGFRGAEPSFIRDFQEHFGDGACAMAIPDCYRCQPHVIQAAHGFIAAFNPDRIDKPEPNCIRREGPLVAIHNVPSDAREAQIIAGMAEGALREGDVLVLLPRREYAESLKAELRKRRIAFDAPARPESDATLVFAALRDWLSDPGDNLAFRELLQAIADGGFLDIPGPRVSKPERVAEREDALAKIGALWTGVFDGDSLREALRNAHHTDDLYGQLEGVANDLAHAVEGTPTEFAERTFDALKPWANSTRLLDELAASPLDARGSREGDANLIRILTMRNSKGLEAETVFVLGLEEGAFPGSDPGTNAFEEDARLFYVSMTRAKSELHLFHARKRSGGLTFKAGSFGLKPSPFVGGLPETHCEARYHPSGGKK